MRIVFVGAVEFSCHCLRAVLNEGGDVVAVITISEDEAGIHSDYSNLSWAADKHDIPVYKVRDINLESNVTLIRSLRPDVIFVLGWSRLISQTILSIPAIGCIGSHPAMLPKNRGRHPIIWALVQGLKESGLTFFYMDDTADSGDILWQRAFPISLDDDARSIYDKIKSLADCGISEFLPQLEQNRAPRISQDDRQATYWRKRTKKDGEIDWSAKSMNVYNLVRGLTHPYVGAHSFLHGKEVKVWKAALPSIPLTAVSPISPPGTILSTTERGFSVKTGDSYLTIDWKDIEVDSDLQPGIPLGR